MQITRRDFLRAMGVGAVASLFGKNSNGESSDDNQDINKIYPLDERFLNKKKREFAQGMIDLEYKISGGWIYSTGSGLEDTGEILKFAYGGLKSFFGFGKESEKIYKELNIKDNTVSVKIQEKKGHIWVNGPFTSIGYLKEHDELYEQLKNSKNVYDVNRDGYNLKRVIEPKEKHLEFVTKNLATRDVITHIYNILRNFHGQIEEKLMVLYDIKERLLHLNFEFFEKDLVNMSIDLSEIKDSNITRVEAYAMVIENNLIPIYGILDRKSHPRRIECAIKIP